MNKLHFMSYSLDAIINGVPTDEDRIQADLEMISIKQYMFNKWLKYTCKTGAMSLNEHVELSRWKCWFWWLLPDIVLDAHYKRFKGWKIGHCLNCDADPYDGVVESWHYGLGWFNGALIKCNKCGQYRWQAVNDYAGYKWHYE